MESKPVINEFSGIAAKGLRNRYIGSLSAADAGERVSVCGWVARVREHGEHLVFVDVRDYSGIVQVVAHSSVDLRSEYVVQVAGLVSERPEGTVNPDLATGEIELTDTEITVLSAAEPPPFAIQDRVEVDEAMRLKFRYLDLRRDKMQHHLRMRARINSAIRASMERQGFTEIETPLLWTPTPEGAREFVVPSRLHQGSTYVLPQSPQIAKQLLMVAGFDRYYQIARCLRDEDLRADRQFEFTQLDLEASFVTQRDIMDFISDAVIAASRAAGISATGEVGEISWKDAMDRFGTDKPDMRFGNELIDVSAVFSNTSVRALSAPCLKALVAPNPSSLTRSKLDDLVDRAKGLGAKGLLWLRAVAGSEGLQFESPVSKFFTADESKSLMDVTKVSEGDVVLIVGDAWEKACHVLGQIRLELGRSQGDPDEFRFVWVVDFPLFEGVDEQGRLISAHHPFTMPNEEDFSKLESDPLSVRSQSYDLVLNGWELGSGSIRIHRADIQSKVFASLGITEEEAGNRFGFLLDAFKYGAPPHGGFAFGIDRLAALLVGEDNIREVIAFPKTQSGADVMTGAPKEIDTRIWDLLGLSVKAPKKYLA
ncbi:MAG: aspartate--tRNA ligase [Actinomycetota bacterium]|nr:MAG: aspartate--tRNA ligase [Actinomycetota bacterium]